MNDRRFINISVTSLVATKRQFFCSSTKDFETFINTVECPSTTTGNNGAKLQSLKKLSTVMMERNRLK